MGWFRAQSRSETILAGASEIYSASALFRKAYAYAIKNYDKVGILSAKYGFLLPDDRIEPYNLTLKNMTVDERKDWAERTFDQMRRRLDFSKINRVFFHTGKEYRAHLIPKIEGIGTRCVVPLQGLHLVSNWRGWEKYLSLN